MKLNTMKSLVSAVTLAVLFNLSGIARSASAATLSLIGLTEDNTLISFSPDALNRTRTISVTGVDGRLIGIDVRSADGLLYGITDTSKIYTIDLITGEASFKSMLNVPFEGGITAGVDFNPAADRLRLVGSNDQNFRINVDTGMLADFDLNTPGLQIDGNLSYADTDANAGANPSVTAAAYTNAFPGPATPAGVTPPTRTTQLFGIDSDLDVLVLQNPPNNGTLRTIGSLGVDFGPTGGFDIFSPIAGENIAFAASGSALYSINLSDGTATPLGAIGNGDADIIGLASATVPESNMVSSIVGLGAVGAVGFLRRRNNAASNTNSI